MRDLNDKLTGGTLSASEWNDVPSEIQAVIEGLGITLSGADLNQLGKAISGYVANGTFYTDSGAANAVVLTAIGSKQVPTAYTNGLEAEFIVNTTNTAACTVNIAGLGVKNITNTALAGTLTVGDIVRLRYNTTSGAFDAIKIRATQTDVDAGTDDERYVSPKKLRFGFSILLATNGYIVLPSWLGGLIIQWGEAAAFTSNNETRVVSYPLAFPTSCVFASPLGTGGEVGIGVTEGLGVDSHTNNDLTIKSHWGNGTLTLVKWIAIGS